MKGNTSKTLLKKWRQESFTYARSMGEIPNDQSS
jgi:hypothetical protein